MGDQATSRTWPLSTDTARPALSGAPVTVKSRDNRVFTSATTVQNAGVIHSQLERRGQDQVILLRLNSIDPSAVYSAGDMARNLWRSLFPYVAPGQDAEPVLHAELVLPSHTLHNALLSLGAAQRELEYSIPRSAMFQLYGFALPDKQPAVFPWVEQSVEGAKTSHPLRPPKPSSPQSIYSRYVPHLDACFKLNVCGLSHLETLHGWMNDPRVDEFWEEKGTLEQHEKFIAERTADPHTLAVIGSYVPVNAEGTASGDAEPATYSEIYWVKEDRLGPLMPEVRNYDRGLHMLVGSNGHRGPHRVRAWLPSLVHFCFLDDPRTERVVCEPNAKNAKMIQYLESVGFKRHGDVTFPHKTAALMIVIKEDFYVQCPF